MKHESRSFGLDLARAMAISLVLFAHFVYKWTNVGFWGVELFFALSGFLIGQILWRNYAASERWNFENIKNFWTRRWWRTLPNYYLFFLVMIAFHYSMGNQLPTPWGFAKVLVFSQDLVSSNYKFFGVAWSLCIEEWFYLLFPLVLFVFSLVTPIKKRAFILTLISFVVFSTIMRFLLKGNNEMNSLREITFQPGLSLTLPNIL